MEKNLGGRKMMSPCRKPGMGRRDHRSNMVQYNIAVDEETAAALHRQAVNSGRSVSEIVRTYITWGLEDEEKE